MDVNKRTSRLSLILGLFLYLYFGLVVLLVQGSEDNIIRIGNEVKPSFSGIDVPGVIFLVNDKILKTGICFAFSFYFKDTTDLAVQLWRPQIIEGIDTAYSLIAEYRITPSVVHKPEDIYIESLFETCTMVQEGDRLGIYVIDAPSPVPYVFDPTEPNALAYTIDDMSKPTQVGDVLVFNSLVFPYDFSMAAYLYLNDSDILPNPTMDPNATTAEQYRVECPEGLLIPGRFSGTLPSTIPTPPPTGKPGATGPEGPMGVPGQRGPTGLNGVDGPAGPIGPKGPAGGFGPEGPQGDDGAAGPEGSDGLMGGLGATGIQGPMGVAGATGLVGPKGDAGNPGGPVGPIGPPGASGDDGIDGKSFNNTINAVPVIAHVAGGLTLLELILIIWLAVVSLLLFIVLIVICCFCCKTDKNKQDKEAYKRYMSENPYDDPVSKNKYDSVTKLESGTNGGAVFGATNGMGGVPATPTGGLPPPGTLDRSQSNTSSAYNNKGYSSGTGFDYPGRTGSKGGPTLDVDNDDSWKASLREDVFTDIAVDTVERDAKRKSSNRSSEYLGY